MPEILDTPFDTAGALADFEKTCGDAGAVVSFLGRVRWQDGVTSLELQSYPGVTEDGISCAMCEAQDRWPLTALKVIHRIGKMAVGDPIVLVMTASKHRRAAFEACDFLMDYLKTEAIFWKKQTGPDGTEWIEPRPADYNDNKRWSKT